MEVDDIVVVVVAVEMPGCIHVAEMMWVVDDGEEFVDDIQKEMVKEI